MLLSLPAALLVVFSSVEVIVLKSGLVPAQVVAVYILSLLANLNVCLVGVKLQNKSSKYIVMTFIPALLLLSAL